MKYCLLLFTLGLLLSPEVVFADDNEGRIYGTVTTRDGEVYEGLIRWDQNEVGWLDILDGDKVIDRNDSESRPEIRILGIRFRIQSGSYRSDEKASGIRFGHIKSLENTSRNKVLLFLRDGRQMEMRSTSSDIGQSIRSIIVEDRRRGIVDLTWRDIESINFTHTPAGLTSHFGDMLYGTVHTRHEQTFSGYICWDMDESLKEDLLDGEDSDERAREIPFKEITEIERYGNRRARVVLKNGETVVLSGTNDVNRSNRDILVLDPSFGQARVSWEEFERLVLEDPPFVVTYADFPASVPLRGTVITREGESYSGDICWDNDETYTWELLDGSDGNIDYDIEFGFIQRIERNSSRSAVITLHDGRLFELSDSNDVDQDNDGIFITLDDGEIVILDWYNFERIDFEKP